MLRKKVRSPGNGAQEEFKGVRSRALVGRKDIYTKKQKLRPYIISFPYELEARSTAQSGGNGSEVQGIRGMVRFGRASQKKWEGCFEGLLCNMRAQLRFETSKLQQHRSTLLWIHLQQHGAEKEFEGGRVETN